MVRSGGKKPRRERERKKVDFAKEKKNEKVKVALLLSICFISRTIEQNSSIASSSFSSSVAVINTSAALRFCDHATDKRAAALLKFVYK